MRKDIELFRIVAAFGIVWFHSGNTFGREIAYGGLIFFVIVSAYFSTVSNRPGRPLARFKRLMIPFFIWSIFYDLFNFVGTGQLCREDNTLFNCVLSSSASHLWYLPYMCAIFIAIDRAKIAFNKNTIGIVAGCFAIALILLAPYWIELELLELASPLDLDLHSLSAVLIGVYFGCYYQLKSKLRLLILSAIILAVMLMAFILPEGVGIPYLSGLLPSLLLLRSDLLTKQKFNIYPISSLMFGVYLIHMFFLLVFWKIGFDNYALPVVVFLLSTASIFGLKRVLPKSIHRYLA